MRFYDDHDIYTPDTPTNAELVAEDAADEAEAERLLEERPWEHCSQCKDLTQHDTAFLDMCEKCQTAYPGAIKDPGTE